MSTVELARSFLSSLRQSERLPGTQWPAYQTPLLEHMCRHAAIETDFYRHRLTPLFDGGDVHAGVFRRDRWESVPILTRADARSFGERLFARNVPAAAGATVATQTSGSTGPPLNFRRSALAEAAAMAIFERILEWYGVDRSAALGWIRFDPEPGAGRKEGRGWNLASPDVKRLELSKAVSSREALDWLIEVAPPTLLASPSIIDEMVKDARRSGHWPRNLAHVLVTSETPPEGLRAGVAELFGAVLIDSYGTRETGQIAIDCPDDPTVKHISSEIMLVEIVKADGAVARPGEAGRVVVTPFFNYAMPLIRYDVGDIATQGEASCSCGRTLPTIGPVLGRQNALFRSRDGTRRRPTGLTPLYETLAASQLQYIQTDFECLEVRYAPDPAKGPPDEVAATELLRARIHKNLRITFVRVDRIPRGPGGKYEEFVTRFADV